MKVASFDNPVRASWLAEQGYRLDAGPYVSEAYAARAFLQRLRTQPLRQVAARIFHPGRFRREWTRDSQYGVPFLGSADIFEADLSYAPMITKSSFSKIPRLRLEPGWTLITCSGMTSGRVTYSRLSMSGSASSQDVMRVVPDLGRIPGGYLYTFLASRWGLPIIKGVIYGTSVKHIEPEHIADLPVPRLGDEVERQIDALVNEAMALRQRYENGVVAATRDLFESAGLVELLHLRWHERRGEDVDFHITGPTPASLRALNYTPRARRILDLLASVPHRPLGDICAGGLLRRGSRFTRVDADPASGVKLVGQRQAFWMRPYGRWINPREATDTRQRDETVLIAAHGTLGESEVFSRSILVTGSWLGHAYSEDFVRVLSGTAELPGAYLFAFFRSEAAFRVLRSMSVGGKQQEYHPALLRALPVPECGDRDRERIAETIRQAYRDRGEADEKEDQAFALLDDAVREVAS
jgi:type I restriction enzyme S subunit